MKSYSTVIAALFLAAGGLLAFLLYQNATGTPQASFPTAEAAAQALLTAAETDDLASLRLMFGLKGEKILSSGDPVQDKNRRAMFVKLAKQSMKIQTDPSNHSRALIVIGDDDFVFPVPVRDAWGRWRFDVEEGEREVLARRIGGNEIDAIRLCAAYVEAQQQFASEDHDRSGVHEYALRFVSSPGKRDGLYWSGGGDASTTPIADLVTQAAQEGYDTSGEKAVPYHGYRFQILTGQGPNAEGGAAEYMVHGMLIGGFGLVAWPVEYGTSGVKTFLVNQAGVVYEKDLGQDTSAIALAMKTFNPDSTWKAVK